MNIPNFKGVKVCSKYDGMGIVESIDKTFDAPIASLKVTFDNGVQKSFRIPLAFNSGLLSSTNKKLKKYLKELNDENETFIHSFQNAKKPNQDIPTLQDLGLTISHDGLTRQNLALLGALDDFYQLYTDINTLVAKHMVDRTKQLYSQKNIKYSGEIIFHFPETLDRQIRKMVEPLINRYLYIFTNEYEHIFASAYAFESFFYYYHNPSYVVTFDLFYILIHGIYLNIFYKWKSSVNPTVTRSDVFYWVRERIQILSYLQRKKSLVKNDISFSHPENSDVLHVISSLSNTLCYQQKHSIISASYLAQLSDKSDCVSLPVHYCTTCCKFFIGAITLLEYEKCYGRILSKKIFDEDVSGYNTIYSKGFDVESLLHQNGYSVKAGGLSDIERQNLLVDLIDSNRVSYYEICRIIEQNIHLFQGKSQYSQAVSKWKSDLKFIGDYIKSQK